ncbi:hypothetical protein CBR_g102 [Chara braunii]|uniref:Cdc23 domain-containing protein n=1 Tax=Chara braunii TaxID=69332 RepID=A0A388JLQ8_CHABU|nr:hypothetical protein CBR_g102 [Chara braunii]|eukprot:GBG58701.1 hypothetical protein CBR_g102 [Chara braunii]
MEAFLVDCVCESLRLYMYSNATFLCERLYAGFPTESNLHLLSTCYYRSNQPQRAYLVLKGAKSPQSRYLYALACMDLNKLVEAEAALLPPDDCSADVPNGAAGHYLLGVISRLTDRRQNAISHYSAALSLDPFFWCAYEELCQLGAEEEAAALYGDAAISAIHQGQYGAAANVYGGHQGFGGGDGVVDIDQFDYNSRTPIGGSKHHASRVAPSTAAPSTSGMESSTPSANPGDGTGLSSSVLASPSSYVTPSPVAPPVMFAPPALPRAMPGTCVSGGAGHSAGAAGVGMAAGSGDGSAPKVAVGVQAPTGHRRKFVDEGKLRKVSGRLFAEPSLSGVRRSSRLAEGGAVLGAGQGGGPGPSCSLVSGGVGSAAGASAGVVGPCGPGTSAGVASGPSGASTGAAPPAVGVGKGSSFVGVSGRVSTKRGSGTSAGLVDAEEIGRRGLDGGGDGGVVCSDGGGGGGGAGLGSMSSSGSSRAFRGRSASRVGDEDGSVVHPHSKAGALVRGGGARSAPATTTLGSAGADGDNPHDNQGAVGIGATYALGKGRTHSGALEAFSLLRIMGEGFRLLCMFRCQDAADMFLKLPTAQYATGWVLCQVGRAYLEMVEYAEAERAFQWARRTAPHRLEGMDLYSTVLYHMKKEVELAHLAHEAVALDRLSPQSWCIIGNCFSLQREHETALRFFQRALQLHPNFTYAHTLCGHEYVAIEDFEEGLHCYRNAIRIDSRHYNAWYGLGTIYYRQEKYELAEYHFRRALAINHSSSVLYCYLGMALHALERNCEALALLSTAIAMDSKNPLAKFQKANVLMAEERYTEALAELERLKEVAPREASVYFAMGKIYKKLDKPDLAMVQFCMALDLKPSSNEANLIKLAIEKLNVPDDCEDENL